MNRVFITDQIDIAPPLTWAEIKPRLTDHPSDSRTGPVPYRYIGGDAVIVGDLMLVIDVVCSDGPNGTERRNLIAAAIAPADDEEVRGLRLDDTLAQIAADFSHSPDGTERAFTGHLSCDGDDGDQWRLYLRGGQVRRVDPDIVWNEPPESSVDAASAESAVQVWVEEATGYWMTIDPGTFPFPAALLAATNAGEAPMLGQELEEALHACAAEHDGETGAMKCERTFGAIVRR